jgi:hypothetical protein
MASQKYLGGQEQVPGPFSCGFARNDMKQDAPAEIRGFRPAATNVSRHAPWRAHADANQGLTSPVVWRRRQQTAERQEQRHSPRRVPAFPFDVPAGPGYLDVGHGPFYPGGAA